MEKFGIFDLLDTLSAIMATDSPAKEPSGAPAMAQPAETDDGKITPKQTDSAFAPPSFGTDENGNPPTAAQRDALGAFLERHDAISRKIDKK